MTSDTERRVSLHLPWATLLKIIAALAIVVIWLHIWWILLLMVAAILVAVALAPVVDWLDRRCCPRWLAASAAVVIPLAAIIGFFLLSGSALAGEAQNLSQQLVFVQQELKARMPEALWKYLSESTGRADTSTLAVYAASLGRSVVAAVTGLALAAILVIYLLIESEPTYRWVRGFVPRRHWRRFDQTAAEAREAAFGYVAGNFITSVFAAAYVGIALTLLGVPAALLLAVLAFAFDFVPVLGFFLACIPAIVMAGTRSASLALGMIPLYLAYHFIENYVIAPRVYGDRLRLSNVAVLIGFAVGAELGGVIGALLALPLTAIYPTVEKLWLRQPFGADVVAEHESLRRSAG